MTRSLINILTFFSLVIIFSSSFSHSDTPAVFIIGDSLLDIGTNNFVLQAIAKAKYPHYGVDYFNSTPSGRFSNGLNMADYIAKVAFGESVTSPPAYLSLFSNGKYSEKRLAKAIDFNLTRRWRHPISSFDPASMGSHENPSIGINFASAGTAILDINAALDQAVPLREQISQITTVHGNLTATIGPNKTQQLFERSAFFIGIGNNDVHFFALARAKLNPDWYVGTLIQAYNATLKILYNLGARKFGIIAVPHVGCSPLMRVTILGGNCSKIANDLAEDFNTRLEHLLSNMTAKSNNGTATSNQMVYSIANSYDLLRDYYDNPKHYNFKNVNDACCGNGRFNAMTNCLPVAKLCKNRDEYLFWDVSHPSEYTQRIMVEAFAFGGPQYVRPINWAKLVSL